MPAFHVAGWPRVYGSSNVTAGAQSAREEYRARARALEPLFGATAGLRYAITRSPDEMHSLRSRMVVERFPVVAAPVREKYLRISGAGSAALPPAYLPARLFPAKNIYEEASIVEASWFDERSMAVAPDRAPVAEGRVTGYRESGQTIVVDVIASAPALMIVNQTYFRAWRARAGTEELATLPVNIDRLGVIVPAGQSTIELRFGRQRVAVAVSMMLSLVVLFTALVAQRVEVADGAAGQVERAGDEDRPRV